MENNYDIPDNSLLIFVGVAGSGKSTIAKKLTNDESCIVSSDAIRKELFGNESVQTGNALVFEEFYRRIEERMKNGQFTIADSTALREDSRQKLYDLAQKYDRPIRVVLLNVTLEQIKTQNQMRDRKVPESAIDRMFSNLTREYKKIAEEVKKLKDAKICDVFVKNKDENVEER